LELPYAHVTVVSSTESVQTEKMETTVKDLTQKFSLIPCDLRLGISKLTLPSEAL